MKITDMELVSMVVGEERYKTEIRKRLTFADEALAVMEIVQATLTPSSPLMLVTTVNAMLRSAKEQGRLNGI